YRRSGYNHSYVDSLPTRRSSYLDFSFHVAPGFIHHFFNASRVDAAVLHECFECTFCNLASDWIKTGQNYCFRCVVDNKIDTWQRSEEHTSELQSCSEIVCRLLRD